MSCNKQADKIISKGLKKHFPEIPVITEEQVGSHSLNAQVFFIVDPLDGTKEFIKRRGDFTVNIALVCDGKPIRGIVYAPARKRLFYTNSNGKAVEEKGHFSFNIMVISTSEIKISVLVSSKHVKRAIAALHKEFKLE